MINYYLLLISFTSFNEKFLIYNSENLLNLLILLLYLLELLYRFIFFYINYL